METIGIRQLKNNVSKIIKKVETGAVVRVLRHGKEVAELRPINIQPDRKTVIRLIEKDIIKGGTGIIGPVRSVENKDPAKPVSDIICEDRR